MDAAAEAAVLSWGTILSGLFGGLALFLFGLDKLSTALRAVAGDRMRAILGRLTGNRWLGVLTGATVTAVIQSSSVTSVLVVGFISAGVMSLPQAVGVIFGANIGTTVTAQIVAFKITDIALPLVAAGFAVRFTARADKVRDYGTLVMGLGLVFFGMVLMGDAMYPLRRYPPFIDLMAGLERPALGILVGAVFTALVQSSSATTGIVIVMAGQGLITLEAGIALVFGANVGTCVTALLAAIGKPRAAVRASLVHVLFNIGGVLLWLAFIPDLAAMVTAVSPAHADLAGAARLAAEVPRQIANAHTLFNVVNTLVFIGFAGQTARLVTWLVPERPRAGPAAVEPKYLKSELISTPALALDAVQKEIGRLGVLAERMTEAVIPAALTGSAADLRRVAAMDTDIDTLHAHIVDYMRQVGKGELHADLMERYLRLMAITNTLESLGDVIETDIVQSGLRRVAEQVEVSPETRRLITDLHARATEAVHLAVQAAMADDRESAQRVLEMKAPMHDLAHRAIEHGARRLTAPAPNRLRAYTREMDLIERLRRIYYLARRIAKAVHGEAADAADATVAAPGLPTEPV